MEEVSTIGLDLAEHVFQVHGASAAGAVLLRKRLRREKVLSFFAGQPRCRVAMEACASAHYWARAIGELGHEVRLIPPAYVKPFVKRQKNDMADAEAICEAAQRPTMRFVAVKSEAKQAAAVVFRARDLLIAQRTQIINALRGHVGEYGLIAPQGPSHIERLIAQIEDVTSSIPNAARSCLLRLVGALRQLQGEIAELDKEIAARAREDEVARRLMTVPGIGPLIATAIEALAPPVETFRSGRDFGRLDRIDTHTAINWRQGTPRANIAHGRTNAAPPANLRGQRCCALGQAQRCPARLMARPNACTKAADGRYRGSRQQECPHRLGTACQRRNISSSSRRRISGRRV